MKKKIQITESELIRLINNSINFNKNLVNEQNYVVKPGDSLSKISKQLGVSVDQIASANNIKNINQIKVGQKLNIPAKGKTELAKQGSDYSKYMTKNYSIGKDTVIPYEQNAKLQAEALKILKSVQTGPKSPLPLHVRGFIDFLLGRTKLWTEMDMNEDEKLFLKEVAKLHGKNGFTYPMWDELGAKGLPVAASAENVKKERQQLGGSGISDIPKELSRLTGANMAGQYKYFLGQVNKNNIIYNDKIGTFTINDNYDFNTKRNSESKTDIIKNVIQAVKDFKNDQGTFYSVIRKLASVRELAGYSGFPVKITV